MLEKSFFKLGILIFSFLLIACSSQQSAHRFQINQSFSSEVKVEENEDVKAQVSDSVPTRVVENESAETQYQRGKKYYYGIGVPQDIREGIYWFEKSAEQGHVYAQFWLGEMYYDGRGVLKNNEKAIYWWEKAAENIDAKAQYEIGENYYYGRGVLKNNEKAGYWFKKAAENGDVRAKEMLRKHY